MPRVPRGTAKIILSEFRSIRNSNLFIYVYHLKNIYYSGNALTGSSRAIQTDQTNISVQINITVAVSLDNGGRRGIHGQIIV